MADQLLAEQPAIHEQAEIEKETQIFVDLKVIEFPAVTLVQRPAALDGVGDLQVVVLLIVKFSIEIACELHFGDIGPHIRGLHMHGDDEDLSHQKADDEKCSAVALLKAKRREKLGPRGGFRVGPGVFVGVMLMTTLVADGRRSVRPEARPLRQPCGCYSSAS